MVVGTIAGMSGARGKVGAAASVIVALKWAVAVHFLLGFAWVSVEQGSLRVGLAVLSLAIYSILQVGVMVGVPAVLAALLSHWVAKKFHSPESAASFVSLKVIDDSSYRKGTGKHSLTPAESQNDLVDS